MMKISQEMMDRLQTQMNEDRWRSAITGAEREGLAERLLSQVAEADLRRFSHQLGVIQSADILLLFELIAQHGTRFHKQPWAAPFFYHVPFDYPHETLLHLRARSQESGHEQPGY